MYIFQFNLLLLIVMELLLFGCVPATGRVTPSPSIEFAPTVAPPTLAPTVTLNPLTPTMLPPDSLEATVTARATASPFPTAGTVEVKAGTPTSAAARRDGLSFGVELPKDSYLAGEGGRASITLRNEGSETLFVYGDGRQPAQVVLLDEQGHEPPPYPWFSPPRPGAPYLARLAPGEIITAVVMLQVPPLEQTANHTYVLWAWTRFSRLAPENNNGPDNIWLRFETGPIPLRITPPDPLQRLIAKLQADRKGWQLKVTDARGQVPNHPLWGVLEAATSSSFQGRILNDNTQSEWAGVWDDGMDRDAQIAVRAWVAAPSHVTAVAAAMVSGSGDASRMFGVQPSPRKFFPSLDAAQAALNLPLYKPKQLPPGAALDRVEVEDIVYDHNRSTKASQIYRFAGNNWLELTQMNSTEPYASAGWGRARYDFEAQRVTIAGSTGYLIQQFGWRILDWKIGDIGFELQAPLQVISRESLLDIAYSVQP